MSSTTPPPNPDPEIDATDESLVAGVARGLEDAFVELYRRRHSDVYRFAYAMSRSGALADDVTQDVFLEVLEDATGYDSRRGSVRAWLLGCARHGVLDRLRRDRRLTAEEPVEEASTECAGEAFVLERQRLEKLHAAIVGLPFDYREVIVLCELQELSYADCAAVLGCPLGTVRSRLHRAKALLAAKLGGLRAAAHDEPPAAALATREACS